MILDLYEHSTRQHLTLSCSNHTFINTTNRLLKA